MTIIKLSEPSNAGFISLPATMMKFLNLTVGSKVHVTVNEYNKVVISDIKDKTTLESLLAKSPNECFELSEEDDEWIKTKPIGKELGNDSEEC